MTDPLKAILESAAALMRAGAHMVKLEGGAWLAESTRLLAERGIPNAAAFFEAAGVGLSDGKDFGLPGFVRLNFGCPPQRLDAALERIRHAVMATG